MTSQLVAAGVVRTSDGVVGDALLVDSGRVIAVGASTNLTSDLPERRYPDGILIPGLRDAHLHPVGYAATLRSTTLATTRSFAEVADRLRRAAVPGSTNPILGMRLNEEALAEGRLPTRALLDSGASDRPILVHRYCGHVAVANSAALRLAEITSETPDPPGGIIDRDVDGTPNGILRETAIELVARRFGASEEVSVEELLDALRRLAAAGLTSIGAILRTGSGAWATLGNELDIAVGAAPDAPIRMGAYVIEETVGSVAESKRRIDSTPGRLRWLGIKRFGDGSFGGHTAAMDRPFVDVPTTGTLRLGQIDEDISEAAVRMGGGAAIHAIGDLACATVIDMFERMIERGAPPERLRLEHASVLSREDIERLSRLGVVASVQPSFLGSEAEWLGRRLGEERLDRTYPFATMDAAGIPLAGGSDCPVESPDPWAGMALARDRAGMVPAEGLSAERAFAMYTAGGAAALGEPQPLSPGSPADFIVVDRDPVTATPDELRETRVLATFVDGIEVEVDRSRPLWLD